VPATVWKVTVSPDDPVKGAADALVTIVLFSDFECPFCGRVEPTLEQLLATFPGQVRVVWKDNPLPFHKNARLASEAALAAHAQGKFWEYHDLLFQNQRALGRADLERYAEQLGLDLGAFRAALDGGTYGAQIDADQQLARDVNANGTPNLFVNGRQIVGARPYEDFEPLVREELEKAQRMVAQGVSPGNVYNQILLRGKVFQPLAEEVKDFALDGSPSKGAANAPIVITEFSDFQCPYCARVGAPLLELQQRYPERVRVVFKHFPLTSIHPDAQLAAEASMAAHAQGRFWEYAEVLFQNQKALKRDDLERHAANLGLDVAAFRRALDEGTYRAHVQRDVTDASQAEVRGTPTVFINGRHFQPAGGMTVEALEQAIKSLP
jgi:protein-disulfide isomerase